jgi:hypothetical protein
MAKGGFLLVRATGLHGSLSQHGRVPGIDDSKNPLTTTILRLTTALRPCFCIQNLAFTMPKSPKIQRDKPKATPQKPKAHR